MNGYSNNNVHTPLILIIVALTLIASPTITYLTSPYNANAAQFKMINHNLKKRQNLLVPLVI
jgi:hypothetical protein